MTKLAKAIARETSLTFQGRNVIVEISAPGYITFREKGRRQKWTAPAPLLMQMLIERQVEDKRLARRKTRSVKRGLCQ